MQAIGGRIGSAVRCDLPFPDNRRNPLVVVSPNHAPDGSPWIVVDDYTDFPAQARSGHEWVIDIDPGSRTYGDAVEVPVNSGHHGIRLQQYWRQLVYSNRIGSSGRPDGPASE